VDAQTRRTSALLKIVREHNRLNGVRFVIAEFVLVAVAALLIALSGKVHQHGLVTLAGAGILMNSLTVIAVAMGQIRAGERGQGLSRLVSPDDRAALGQKYPGLALDTLILLLFVLSPFLLPLWLLLERIWHSRVARS